MLITGNSDRLLKETKSNNIYKNPPIAGKMGLTAIKEELQDIKLTFELGTKQHLSLLKPRLFDDKYNPSL